ncbi:hypothetical protein ONZ51_g10169 [Trametes cubensis]|uniref:Flavin reductase like domain-containing protein n=1 Tax=Trametes cubensis TaxID=1111947 RepID=A0AAD7TMJ5_9APHY|nr:hypothetical protein ONZ51_g10169 [Trametes cubensis]
MLSSSFAHFSRASRVYRNVNGMSTRAGTVQEDLRALLRETAQPVAVVTALKDTATNSQVGQASSPFHGATLSSFSSIAMEPHPLVTFALRIPSRMATSLTSAHSSGNTHSHMVINILSEHQAETAKRFSRADLYPEPFASLPYTLTKEGLPILDGSLGAMSCRLVAASWPLHDLESLNNRGKEGRAEWRGEGVASELFIAQVTRVERAPSIAETVRPLLYYRRGYVTTHDIGTKSGSDSSS